MVKRQRKGTFFGGSLLENSEKQKLPKVQKTKRKSLLPPPQKLTPLDQLEYRESASAVFDPDLAIPNERFIDSNSNKYIRPELITGEGKRQNWL